MEYKLKGSLTVEAALVMITVLSVMFGAIMAAFDIYEEGVMYIYDNPVTERDAPDAFRAISWGKEMVEELKGE